MADAPPLNAAFFAFARRDKSFVLTAATLGYFVVYAVLMVGYAALTWSAWGPLFSWYMETLAAIGRGNEPTLPPGQPLWRLAPAMGAFALLALILFAAYEAACLRWLVRGESGGGFLGLRLGGDTWRVFAIYWLWLLLSIVFMCGVAILYLGLRALGEAAEALRLPLLVIAALAPLGLIALGLWLAVRLAPGAAISVARGRFAFFEAWGATRGRFWPLLGAFFIVCVGYFVVATIAQQVLQIPLQQRLTPAILELMQHGDADRAMAGLSQALATPEFVAWIAVYALVSFALASVFYVAMFGVNARVVQAASEQA